MSLWTELNGQLAILGGVSGLALLFYFVIMTYFARRKDRHIQEMQMQIARIEGILLGRSKK